MRKKRGNGNGSEERERERERERDVFICFVTVHAPYQTETVELNEWIIAQLTKSCMKISKSFFFFFLQFGGLILNIFPVGIKRKYTVFLRFEFVFIYLD
jgi:hypothetical protein